MRIERGQKLLKSIDQKGIAMTEIRNLEVIKVKAGNNDREIFDSAALAQLAASIEKHGLAQPITVRPVNGYFEIVAGERRFRAISQILNWETIPCIVREMSDAEASAIMLAENTGRADLNPIEEAKAYKKRSVEFGWSAEEIAKIAGVSKNLVTRRISLLDLVSEIRLLLSFGNIGLCHAEYLTKLDPNRQRIALRIYNRSTGITLRAVRHIVNQLFEEQSQESLFDLENFWIEQVAASEDLITSGYGAVVNVPKRNDLPAVVDRSEAKTTSQVIKRFIDDLVENGNVDEAAVVGTLFSGLVRSKFCNI